MRDEPYGEPSASEPAPPAELAPAAAARPAALVLVSTPIGNLDDVSTRAIATLREVDLVLCEDTRTTARLLARYAVGTRTEALHDHNEEARLPSLLARLHGGQRLALVSDAGTPLVSDPGYRLVRAAIAEGITISGVPGPNAALMALTLSGLPPHPFLFAGFPPPRAGARRHQFSTLRAAEQAGLSATLVWHEAPHRLADMLADLAAVFAERPAAVCRELTKRFEEVRRGPLPELAAHYAACAARGEVTVVIGPGAAEATSEATLDARLVDAMGANSVKDAAALVAVATGVPRRTVYARALELKSHGLSLCDLAGDRR